MQHYAGLSFLILFSLLFSLKSSAQNVQTFLYEAQRLRAAGQYDQAIEYYGKAISLNEKLGVAYAERGYSYARLKKYDKALVDYEFAIINNHADALLYLNRGWAYFNLGEKYKACVNWQKCKELGYSGVRSTLEEHCPQ